MTPHVVTPNPSAWRGLASLGEQLASADSLSAQQERILEAIRRLVNGRVSLWLDEVLFRLPDRESTAMFPADPPLGGLRRAFEKGEIIRSGKGVKNHWIALPISDHGMRLGALQVSRAKPFRPEELDILEGFSSIVAIGLYSSHRAAVERFRLGQLNLVRQVSAQIANVLEIDELARSVTGLIQKTFNYYFVAFFTFKPGAKSLRFRASASAPRPGRKKNIIVDAELGEGMIGRAAETGERVLSDDVKQDSRYRFYNLLPETRSEVSLPIKIEDRVLGVLDVQSNQPAAFHPNDLLVLEALVDSIARGVEGARLYGDLRRRADQLSLIAEVSKGVTSSLDLTQLMRSAAQLIQKRFGYPFVHMYSVHPNRRTIEFEAGSGRRSRRLQGFAFSL
ncbi:MAG: GAF domain-containing protein, partial [Anaerolineaceae bacterium]|nr:GAF domain-containing protein [Anaerolineaceae bacterium]